MINNSFVAERIREARESANLTQVQLAEATNMTREVIANIENGRTRVFWDTVVKIAQATGRDISWFSEVSDDI